MRKLLLTFIACFIAIAAHAWSVKFTNPDNWSNVYVYVFGSNASGPAASWPGASMTKSGDVWTYEYSGTAPASIIFNAGNNQPQTGDLTFGAANDGKTFDKYGPVGAALNDYSVYFDNSTAKWTEVYAYCWDGVASAPWPGDKVTTTDSRGYYVFEYKAAAAPNANAKIIWNNGGNGKQTANLTYVPGEVYDQNGPLSAKEEVYSVYLNNTAGWDKVYVYTFNPELAGSWPGTELQKNNSTGLYEWNYTSKVKPECEGIIFNNGGNGKQTDNLAYSVGTTYTNGDGAAEVWVNLNGEFHQDGDNGVKANAEGIASWENQAIGSYPVYVKVWDGADAFYQSTTPVVVSEWTTLNKVDTDNNPTYIKGQQADCVFNVQYNINTNQIKFELVSGTLKDEEPGDEITELYVIGNFTGNNDWTVPGKSMDDEGDGIFAIYDLTLNAGDGYGYFALTTNGTNNWDLVNANRMSPKGEDVIINATIGNEVEIENVTKNAGDKSWRVPAGIYTLTYTVEDEMLVVEKTAELPTPEPTYPEVLYLYGDVEGNVWNPTKGNLTDNQGDGLYVIEDVKIVAAQDNTLGYFAFSTVQAENDDEGGWAYVNGSRYGTSTTTLVEDYTGTKEYTIVKGGQESFSIKPGTYTIYANLDDMTLTVEGEADVETPEVPEAWYLYTESNWGKGNEMKLQEGTTDKGEYVYKVSFPELSAPLSFKIFSSEEGQSEPAYGAGSNGTFNGTDVTLEAVLNGGNFANWTLLEDATFTFYYNPAGQSWLQLQGTEVAPTVLYVKGDYDEWKGNIQLTRTSDELTENGEYTFSASVEALDGAFKISQFKDNWNGLNYGGQGMGENPNSTLQANGATLEAWYSSDVNFTADKLENVTINFYYNPDKEKASWLNAVTETPAAPEYFTVAFGASTTTFPVYNPEGTKLLPTEADPNIYEGIVEVGKSQAMAFFTDTEVPYTGTMANHYLGINMKTYPNWPAEGNASQIAQAKLFSNEGLAADDQVKMYVTNFLDYPTTAKTADIKISINWAEQSFSLELMPYVEKAPNAMYLWGSVNGNETITNMATLEKAANADVYTLENYVVPACGIFDTSDENVTVARGFSFYISDNATSKTGGTIYMAPTGDSDINLTEADDTYNVTANNNKSGRSFLALNPGVYNFTLNYNSLEFTAELVTPYNQVQFDIVGGANVTNPRQYVTAMTMDEDEETIKFSTNSKLFGYDEPTGVLFALNPAFQADYTLTVTGPDGVEQGETTYVISPYDANGLTGTMVGLYRINNGTFTITVAEKVNDLQLTFVADNFELGTDINDYLTIQDNGALISSGGEDMGMINITSNPFNFVPNTAMGMYQLTLTSKEGYSITAEVAPGTPKDAQINVQDGSGNVMIAGTDLGDNIGVIVTISKKVEEPAVPEFIHMMYGTGMMAVPAPGADDPVLYPSESDPNIYEGIIMMPKNKSFAFYTGSGDDIEKYAAESGFIGISFTKSMEWPSADEDLGKNVLVEDGTAQMYIAYMNPNTISSCNVKVSVNWEEKTFTLEQQEYVAPAPENLYLWGSTNGGGRAVNMADFVKNGNVYTLEFEVPACGIFDTSDSEGGSTIEKGFSFFLCDNATSFTAAGATRYYGPKATSEDEPDPAMFELTGTNNTYTATATVSGAADMGGNFIALTPGLYNFTFNYETKEFKAVLDEEAYQIQLNFVAEGNVASPYKKVMVQKMFPELTTLEISDPEYLFSYMSTQGLNIVANEGYTISVVAANGEEPGTNFSLNGSDADGQVGYQLGLYPQTNGMTFIVTVSEEVADENVYYLGIAQGTVPTAPNMDYSLKLNEDGTVVTGEYTIQPGQSFNIWYPFNGTGAAEGDDNEDNPSIPYQPLGPSSGDEVELYFTQGNTEVLGNIMPSMGYWTLTNEEPVTISFNLNVTTYALTLEAVNEDDLPAPAPEGSNLWFDDWSMSLKTGETKTAVVPVELRANEAFDYKGYQFDIVLPEGLTLTGATLQNLKPNTSSDLTEQPSLSFYEQKDSPEGTVTYRVVAFFQAADVINKAIANLTVSATYGDIEPDEYPVVINVVKFSDLRGNDITNVDGWEGTVTITATAESAEVKSATLVGPNKKTDPITGEVIDMIESVTQGQNVALEIEVSPEEAADDEITVSADNGAQVEYDEATGKWVVNTEGVDVKEGKDEKVVVTVTIKNSEGDEIGSYTLIVRGVILGDSNDNEEVTVADVVTTANFIASTGDLSTVNNFDFPNANVILTEVDGEQVINVQDLTATVNIILETFNGIRNPQNIRRHAKTMVSSDRLVAVQAGQSQIAVNLENTMNYTALQAEIEVPAGMTVQQVKLGARAAAHEYTYGVNAEGNLVVVIYSTTNASFLGGEGSLFDLVVSGNGNGADFRMINIMAADASSNGYELEGFVSDSVASGIDGITAGEEGVEYFTVDGVKVNNPAKGQILIRVANGEATKVLVK